MNVSKAFLIHLYEKLTPQNHDDHDLFDIGTWSKSTNGDVL